MNYPACRFLRPYLHKEVRPVASAGYVRFFSACTRARQYEPNDFAVKNVQARTEDARKRIKKLEADGGLEAFYPRMMKRHAKVECVSTDSNTFYDKFVSKYGTLQPGETARDWRVQVNGRVSGVRRSSSKLVFVTINLPDGDKLQGVCNYGTMDWVKEDARPLVDKFFKHVRKGDWISITGFPHKTEAGQLSVLATSAAFILAPSLNQIPDVLDDQETLARHRHVDLLLHQPSRDIVILRDAIEGTLQNFLYTKRFYKVTTPILNPCAGGAVARPFKTAATELSNTTLDLRIAPELYLKRLIVGGLNAVYEIGPAFRNEGVDGTHNPEFTICEFYKAFATLDELIDITEQLFMSWRSRILRLQQEGAAVKISFPHRRGYRQLEFIPELEGALRLQLRDDSYKLPDLSKPEAVNDLSEVFDTIKLAMPASPSVPRLLDALCGHLIEPKCDEATFIKHHPAVMSPLAKSFICAKTGQLVSARAELFIKGVEYANMYEEENSPFEQRRKFEEQLRLRGDDGEASATVDSSYIEALEWGMPPTGGWGCGIDRIVMLFAGADRIADVLPFGTLRNVVGMAQNGRPAAT